MNSFFEGNIWPLRGKLYRMAILWVKDASLAEDLLQAVFEKAFRREGELISHPNLAGWLMKSLKNEARMHYRSEAKMKDLEGLELTEAPAEMNPEDNRIKKVIQILNKLPEKQREIFQLREVEGLTYEEIAQYLDVSLEQVKVNLHRARKSIREKIINQGKQHER